MEKFNNVAIFIPDKLNVDLVENTIQILDQLLNDTKFNISLYKTQIEDIFSYVLKLPKDKYIHFNFHLYESFEQLNPAEKEALTYLTNNGSSYVEHKLPSNEEGLATRSDYEIFVSRIIRDSSEILSFYNDNQNQMGKILFPLTVGQKLGKQTYIVPFNKHKKIELIDHMSTL